MKAYVVGNPLVKEDSLPLRLLPKLQTALPYITFIEVDPNENFVPDENSVIIDTVEGFDTVSLFGSIDEFVETKSVSPHDYDLGLHLKLLKKLRKINSVSILGIPIKAAAQEKKIAADVIDLLRQLVTIQNTALPSC